MSTALVHIGTHKTGTTAFQLWSARHRDALRERCGVELYEGLYGPSHFEIALLCLRENRTMQQRWRVPDAALDEWKDEVRAHVARQVAQPASRLLISAEGLSLLRYDDEVAALRDLLGPRQIKVAVCFREASSFLESYRHEMTRRGITPSRYRSSHNYVEPDTWLVQWDEMLAVWRRVLGEEAVVSFGYEDVMAEYRSSIPGVLAAFSIDETVLPSWVGVTANTRRKRERSLGAKVVRRMNRFHTSAATIGPPPSRAGASPLVRSLSPLGGAQRRTGRPRAQWGLIA
jgi:hypothetical protein